VSLVIGIFIGVAIGYCLCALMVAAKEPPGAIIHRTNDQSIGWCEYNLIMRKLENEEDET